MHPYLQNRLQITRRHFFGRSATGISVAALAALLGKEHARADGNPGGLPGLPHFAPKARRVIYLLQGGAPSHVDLFDYKPGLAARRGQPLPDSVRMGQRLTTMTAGQQRLPVLPGIAPFRRHGRCGAWLCDFLPHTASIADDIAIIRSMHTEAINHAPAVTLFLTGAEQP